MYNNDLGGKIIATFTPISASDTKDAMLHRIADFLQDLPYEKIPKIKLLEQNSNLEFGTSSFNVYSIGRSNPSDGYYSFDAVEYGKRLVNIVIRKTGSSVPQEMSELKYENEAWKLTIINLNDLSTNMKYYILE